MLAEVLSTDEEEVVDNEYGHDSDFETEISSSSTLLLKVQLTLVKRTIRYLQLEVEGEVEDIGRSE